MKRVCLTGVESSGKSTLAEILALHFGGVTVPEYGRFWAETFGTDFTVQALREIATGHIARRIAVEAQRPAIIIEDTDVVMTSAWAHMLHGARDSALSEIPATADAYLLLAADTPWVDDGTRQFGGAERRRFAALIDEELSLRGITPIPIAGSWSERQAAAISAVTSVLG